MASKNITMSDPDRADRRMITYIMRVHFKRTTSLKDPVYEKLCRVFEKAEGSWFRLFQGSSEDLNLLKKIIKIAIKEGIIPKKTS